MYFKVFWAPGCNSAKSTQLKGDKSHLESKLKILMPCENTTHLKPQTIQWTDSKVNYLLFWFKSQFVVLGNPYMA